MFSHTLQLIMKISFLKYSLSAFLVSVALNAAGCEDAPPNAYTQDYVVQGVLIVDEPIGGIVVQRALPTTDTFSMERAVLRDADVSVTDGNGREFKLQFREGGSSFGDYTFGDTSVKVQPNTLYNLTVKTADGRILTRKTHTPNRFAWVSPPRTVLQFPTDTLNLPSPDSLKISWTETSGTLEYLICITALDTVDYGKYLAPPTDEQNRRRKRFFDREENPRMYNLAEYGYLQANEANTVWNAFKWFGRNKVTVFAADANMLRWFKLYFQRGNQYNSNLGSIKGGIGMFGSAAQVTQEVFLLKNQP